MSKRQTSAPIRVYEAVTGHHDKGDYREEHPAFGVVAVTRGHGTPRALFQSDLTHSETITLSIHRAERGRSLMHDWVHPRKELIEVEMSLAQWGAVVSSIGIGSGVPVTIRRTESEVYVDDLPYEPRIATVVDEAKASVGKLVERIRDKYSAVREAFDDKQGIKAQRQALDSLGYAISGVESNAEFAVQSVTRAAEQVTSQAKSDIEAHILSAAQITGLTAPVQVPELMQDEPVRELEAKGFTPEEIQDFHDIARDEDRYGEQS
jgi:hypothetical protein